MCIIHTAVCVCLCVGQYIIHSIYISVKPGAATECWGLQIYGIVSHSNTHTHTHTHTHTQSTYTHNRHNTDPRLNIWFMWCEYEMRWCLVFSPHNRTGPSVSLTHTHTHTNDNGNEHVCVYDCVFAYVNAWMCAYSYYSCCINVCNSCVFVSFHIQIHEWRFKIWRENQGLEGLFLSRGRQIWLFQGQRRWLEIKETVKRHLGPNSGQPALKQQFTLPVFCYFCFLSTIFIWHM